MLSIRPGVTYVQGRTRPDTGFSEEVGRITKGIALPKEIWAVLLEGGTLSPVPPAAELEGSLSLLL